MTSTIAAETVSAARPSRTTDPALPSTSGEVTTMKRFRVRKRSTPSKRAWDELSETDRAVLLQALRLRREAQSARDAHGLEALRRQMQ